MSAAGPATPRVFRFGSGTAEAGAENRALLGGKGANLAEMAKLGIPVPPGFVIPTTECARFEENGALDVALLTAVGDALGFVERATDASFGSATRPLLVSVRSGARVSMPGMMDTVLNVGLTDATVEGLATMTGDRRFALDAYRRLIQMFADVVFGIDPFYFEEELYAAKAAAGVRAEQDLSVGSLERVVAGFLGVVTSHGCVFPQDPREQLERAICAVFTSWKNDRAVAYRDAHAIPHDWGTAVTIQAMVYGNRGERSGTGVAFTRNPATGARERYGEFLPNAQGEDVVAGTRTPQSLSGIGGAAPSLQEWMPAAWEELCAIEDRLERHYADAQDIEFTIEEGRVWILQTRGAKRTTEASVRVAVDLADEGLIDRDEALRRVRASRLDDMLHPVLDRSEPRRVLARGLAASPGAVTGAIVLTASDAEAAHANGRDVILVRQETAPEDIRGMIASRGILTARGGITSHAAVVARQMGKACVAGCNELTIDTRAQTISVGTTTLRAGDTLTLDGSTGEVFAGEVPTIAASLTGAFDRLMAWADERRRVGVWANADTVADAELARRFGASGIGLARTEHMFFDGDRIHVMREMIVADTAAARTHALERLRPFQRKDFEGLLRVMDGLPVTIRLLDPPLHEFLPARQEDIEALGRAMGRPPAAIRGLVARLHETNPMLGHRGCRLGISHPEIYEMQARAIFDATCALLDEGLSPRPQILIPLVSMAEELAVLRGRLHAVADEYGVRAATVRAIPIGAMIELPRACATADRIAEHADFLSFGTNDLTQTVFGFSRDDVATFLPVYLDRGLLRDDPFVVLDTDGVGQMIKLACHHARRVKPDISIGICGEHAGEPRSVAWIQKGLVEYVSCSPYRVPVARLAAAQAALEAHESP